MFIKTSSFINLKLTTKLLTPSQKRVKKT
ncbi:hypothetical protein XNC3_560002 [Xenorhabdus nematophila F1]|nr:hypothetical protein XNC3_560002 [Xenorhabdus nematophila F1]